MRRVFGCLAAGLLYSFIAGTVLFGEMIGDCDPAEKIKCEAGRSFVVDALACVTLVVACLLIWLFFLRRPKGQGDL